MFKSLNSFHGFEKEKKKTFHLPHAPHHMELSVCVLQEQVVVNSSVGKCQMQHHRGPKLSFQTLSGSCDTVGLEILNKCTPKFSSKVNTKDLRLINYINTTVDMATIVEMTCPFTACQSCGIRSAVCCMSDV